MKEKRQHNWPDVIFKLLHAGKKCLISSEEQALNKFYFNRINQVIIWRLRQGKKILEVVPVEFTKMMDFIYFDLKGYMHQWLFSNQKKLKLLSKNELWRKFDNKAGYYLYDKYFGEAIRDSKKCMGWAVQGVGKYKEDPSIKRNNKGEKIYSEENFGDFNEAVRLGSYYRRAVEWVAKELQQSAKSYRHVESYLELAEEIVEEKLKQAKRELRKNKKSLTNSSEIAVLNR